MDQSPLTLGKNVMIYFQSKLGRIIKLTGTRWLADTMPWWRKRKNILNLCQFCEYLFQVFVQVVKTILINSHGRWNLLFTSPANSSKTTCFIEVRKCKSCSSQKLLQFNPWKCLIKLRRNFYFVLIWKLKKKQKIFKRKILRVELKYFLVKPFFSVA